MQISNSGRGVHKREIVGIEKLRELPPNWYAFTNLEVAATAGRAREIDVILIAEDRIFAVDLKDWDGRIESENGRWLQNGLDCGLSPVTKILQNARDIGLLLQNDLKKRDGLVQGPKVQGLVLITGRADWSLIAPTEQSAVIHVVDFVKVVADKRSRINTFGPVNKFELTDTDWKNRISKFFNAKNGPIRPGRRRYGSFIADSEHATFEHPKKIYAEYDATDETSNLDLGTIRLWDFTKADARFQNEEGRREIAGREKQVFGFLRDANEEIESSLLASKSEDPEKGVGYWEVYDRRKRLERLSVFVLRNGQDLSAQSKIELAKQLISKVAAIHRLNAAHLDIGDHSVWLEAPSSVRLSHLMAAHVPSVHTLGESRYQFLSSVQLPEMVYDGTPGDPLRRDVYLLGVCVHFLLFGGYPPTDATDHLPYWDPVVDESQEYVALHTFFEKALSLEQAHRFKDANEALVTFNEATSEVPDQRYIIEGLERFRSTLRSQRQFTKAFPDDHVVIETDRMDAWISGQQGDRKLVKLWKKESWGDQEREGPRILAFLKSAQDIQLSPWPNCAKVLHVCWLQDAIGLVQEYVEGPTLSEAIAKGDDALGGVVRRLSLLDTLIELIADLHERGSAHGDLKPANIVLAGEDHRLVLIDVLDFSPRVDGERVTPAYSPSSGGTQERDRYAVTKIAEDLLGAWLSGPPGVGLAKAIETCRTSVPANGTLLPLKEAIERARKPSGTPKIETLNIVCAATKAGPLFADEGKTYLRRWASDSQVRGFILRGAVEEIRVGLDNKGSPNRVARYLVDQNQIRRNARKEHPLDVQVVVTKGFADDLSSLEDFMGHPEFTRAFYEALEADAQAPVAESSLEEPPSADASSTYDEISVDEIVEEAAQEAQPVDIDVRALWAKLIEVESEQTIEGAALGDGAYKRDLRRLVVPFELESGVFEFSKGDTVGIEKLDKGRWFRVGTLDLRSRPDAILIDVSDGGYTARIQEGSRLRFLSHFSQQSLKRRRDAVGNILENRARVPSLFDVFDGKLKKPVEIQHVIDEAAVETYRLNDAQRNAFAKILKVRPLGMLQGPPGTGKTAFIGALAHYALTRGLANNILVASQSHEAVNNVAEAILRLFSEKESRPSILRVGNEGVVSDTLLPFHSDKLEQWYKDRFSAEFREKVRLAGRVLGIPEKLCDQIYFIETSARPVIERLRELEATADTWPERATSLRITLAAHLAHLGLNEDLFDDVPIDPQAWVEDMVGTVAAEVGRTQRPSPERIARLRSVIALGRDFINSVSTVQRSFETFLAGTRQIVAGTCVGLGRTSLGLTATPFDLVIVDEAARCTASELAVPVQAGRWLVFVGDHVQLEPQHDNAVVAQVTVETGIPKQDVLRSDFERLFQSPYGLEAGATLKTQYRMLPAIGEIVSSAFYGGNLEPGRVDPVIPPGSIPSDLKHPITWFTTDGLGARAYESKVQGGNSRWNQTEVDAIAALLKRCNDSKKFMEWAREQKKYPQVIGVICMYAEQRNLLRKKLQTLAVSDVFRRLLKVDTVDSYQGKQNPIVIVSLVRNNMDGTPEDGVASISQGFLSRPNRINVAVSRSMDRLVVVGAHQRWRRNCPMAKLAQAVAKATENDGALLRSVSEVLGPETGPAEKIKKQPETAS
jgi:hypothetical protein